MTNHTAKIAVTVPAKTLREVETARRRLGRSRSSIVSEALAAWLAARTTDDRDRAYVEAYARIPETDDDGRVAAAVMSSWDTWEQPARKRGKR